MSSFWVNKLQFCKRVPPDFYILYWCYHTRWSYWLHWLLLYKLFLHPLLFYILIGVKGGRATSFSNPNWWFFPRPHYIWTVQNCGTPVVSAENPPYKSLSARAEQGAIFYSRSPLCKAPQFVLLVLFLNSVFFFPLFSYSVSPDSTQCPYCILIALVFLYTRFPHFKFDAYIFYSVS